MVVGNGVIFELSEGGHDTDVSHAAEVGGRRGE